MFAKADRRARYAISTIFFVDGAALAGYVSHLADIQAKLVLSNGQLGRAILFSALGAVSTMPLAGPLIHRFGSRLVSLAGLGALLVALPALMLAPSVPLLCLNLYIVGATNGQADVAMNTHSMSIQDRFSRPILSAVHGWFSLGGFAGGAGTALAAKLGCPPVIHMAVASGLLAIALVIGISGLLGWETDKDAEAPRLAFPGRRSLFLGALVLISFVTEGSLWDWSTIYLRRNLLATAAIGSFGFALSSVGMALGRFVGDGWTHRFGYRRVLLTSALVSALGMVAAVNLPSILYSILGFCLVGLGTANLVPLLFRAAARQPGLSASAGLSAVATCGYTGFLGGPPLLGYISDHRSLPFALSLLAWPCLFLAAVARRAVGALDDGS